MFVEVFSYDNQLRREGIEKGLEQGRQEKEIEVALEGLKNGLDLNLISTLTKLDIAFIEDLKSQM